MHVFRQNTKLGMQNLNVIFADTEAFIKQLDIKTQEQTLKLGHAIFWNSVLDIREDYPFKVLKTFWNMVNAKLESVDHLYIMAHNMDYDSKLLNLYDTLEKNGWFIDKPRFYSEGMVYILNLSKIVGVDKQNKPKKKHLTVLSTTNFFNMSVKQLGKYLKCPKGDIDPTDMSIPDSVVAKYCKRDTEIIYKGIRQLIQFLEVNDLSKFKLTKASLSFNTFRHKFYKEKEKPIYIHSWRDAVILERNSYRGGISDCLRVNDNKTPLFKIPLAKLDINSMYPDIMKNKRVPTKLKRYYSTEHKRSLELKKDMLQWLHNGYLVIANVKVHIPKENSYILASARVKTDKKPWQKKSIFPHGTFKQAFCSPELNYILQYGDILEVYEYSVYDSAVIFKEYVEFFNDLKIKAEKQDNLMIRQFAKDMENSLSGKFGQRNIEYMEKNTEDFPFLKLDKGFSKHTVVENGALEYYTQMGDKLYKINHTEKNSKESFVAIISFITSYARIKLVSLIKQAGRENCYYMDTDSLFVNEDGLRRLLPEIDPYELGKLKVEEFSNKSAFWRPKFYLFNDNLKCKGVKKTAELKEEDTTKMVFEQQQFEKFKTAVKTDGHLQKQFVSLNTKNMSKIYDKGVVNETYVTSFKVG